MHQRAYVDDGAALESELLRLARHYSFRGRIDKATFSGPILVSAEGSVVTDVRGKEYLDFNSGQACATLGHNHPRIVEAIREACSSMLHSHSSIYNLHEIRLAAKLASVMPDPLRKSLFGESGSDANELAILVARLFTGGKDVFSRLAPQPRPARERLTRHPCTVLLPLSAGSQLPVV